MTDQLPIDSTEFWRQRLQEAIANRALHNSVYIAPLEGWQHIQECQRHILHYLLKPDMRILDAGCGYGALIEILPPRIPLSYLGIDLVPDFIQLAQQRKPNYKFQVANLCSLPELADKQFDLAICRSVEGMVKGNLGQAVWDQMETELLRVANRLLLLNYTAPALYTLLPFQRA
jgi:SAM-dependent methyltransferase